VVARRSAVDCKERRFWRTEAERTMPDIFIPFWCEIGVRDVPTFSDRVTGGRWNQASKEI
jgi:hypothetical protein